MKIPAKNIDAFVRKPAADVLAILLYGPDEGLVRERLDVLTRNVVADIHDPFNVVEFQAGALAENPSRLLDEAQAMSMLGGRRVVRVRDASDKISGIAKDVLSALRSGDNLVLLEAGELPTRSALRSLFEGAGNAAAIPCYVEDQRDIGRVLSEALRAGGFTLPSEALTYFAANVIGDRAVARSEVEKLITYMGDKKSIALDDVIACVGNSAALSLEDLAKHAVSGNFAEAEKILQHVLSEGLPAVSVLRNLQNHFLRLHITKARIQKGENTDSALKKLRPPVFFKLLPAFEAQLSGWSMEQMEQAMTHLVAAEARCKQTGGDPYTLCSRVILSISQIGARATGFRRRA